MKTNEIKNKRAAALLNRFNQRELFRAAAKAGKLQFIVIDGKASK